MGTTPSQTVGPFFHYALTDAHSVADLTTPQTMGRRISITGRVLDVDGIGVPDAMLEIWQANADGRYDHPDDRQDKPLDPAFRGFGRVGTDGEGRYRFDTIMPGPVPGPGNALQAPHILVNVFARGLLKQLVTRVYFAGEALNETDTVLGLVDEARRPTLIAAMDGRAAYVFDIRLSGAGETVFFDV